MALDGWHGGNELLSLYVNGKPEFTLKINKGSFHTVQAVCALLNELDASFESMNTKKHMYLVTLQKETRYGIEVCSPNEHRARLDAVEELEGPNSDNFKYDEPPAINIIAVELVDDPD